MIFSEPEETETSSSGDEKLDTIFTTENQTKPPAVIQMIPHSAGENRRSKSLEDLSRGLKSIGELNSPSSRNLTRILQERSKKYVTQIRKGNAAEKKSQTIEVHVHGSMSQGCDQIENSNFSSIMSDIIVPIDI